MKESIGTYVSAGNAASGFPGGKQLSVGSIVIRRIKLAVDPLKPGGYCDYHRVSVFRPHSLFMCFVWITEQAVIISLYNINP